MAKSLDDIYSESERDWKKEEDNIPKKIIIKQTIGFVAFLIVGVTVLFLGFRQIKNTIQGPSRAKDSTPSSAENQSQDGLSNFLTLQNKDTDADGLSDFDELYVYKTSLYLEDSDSDGYNDKEEVASGHDPLCPASQDCYGAKTEESENIQKSEEELILPAGVSSIQDLRKQLELAGISKDTLDQVDDATLVELYNQTTKDTGFNPLGQEEGSLSTYLESLGDLNADQIRELLIESGVDKAVLDQIDDASLEQLFLETIKEQEE